MRRVQALALLAAVLDVAELRDVLHRPGPVERHQRDDVLDAGRLQLPQRRRACPSFPPGTPPPWRRWRRARRSSGSSSGIAPMSTSTPRRFSRSSAFWITVRVFRPEEVELDQPGFLDPLHVVLGRRHVRARIAVERHQLVQRPVADHHARGVGRGVAEQALDRLGDLEQPRHLRLAPRLLAQARLVGQRLLDRDRLDPLHRDQLREPVDLAVGHLQHPARRRAPPPSRAARRR